MMISGHKTRSVFERYNVVNPEWKDGSEKEIKRLRAMLAGGMPSIDTGEVEDRVGMVDITVATEGIIAGVVDIVGIMVGKVDIMVAAIFTEDPASTSADTPGRPTTIPTGIILPAIITRTPITIRINRMLLPDLPPTPNRSKNPMGTARLPGYYR